MTSLPNTCSVEDCDSSIRALGYCDKHYRRIHKRGTLELERNPAGSICLIQDCNTPSIAKGYCDKHYTRLRTTGRLDLREKFVALCPCTVLDCEKFTNSATRHRGLCNGHYRTFLANGTIARLKNIVDHCGVEGCNNAGKYCNGYCIPHFRKLIQADQINLWKKLNPDKYRQIKAKDSRKRRAAKNSATHEDYTTQQVIDTYGTNCHLCGEPIDLLASRRAGVGDWRKGLHLDHVLPLALGGPDTLSNVKPAHAECNLRKHHRLTLPVQRRLL